MPLAERVAEPRQARPQILRRVVAMVQVHLDFTEAAGTQAGQSLDDVRPVYLQRCEECVLRRHAVGISERTEAWILSGPSGDAAILSCRRGAAVIGFEMVGDAEQDVDRFARIPA